MEKTASGNAAAFVDRRLHPVRLSLDYLNRLLEGAKGGSVTLDRNMLYSITSTLELFIEDFEIQCMGGKAGGDEKRMVEKGQETPRVTQTRVG